jgi:hypothetical protein
MFHDVKHSGLIDGHQIVGGPTIFLLNSSDSREKLMYDMYPDAWTVAADRQHQVPTDQPRRRARKEHSVVPVILQVRAHKAAETG